MKFIFGRPASVLLSTGLAFLMSMMFAAEAKAQDFEVSIGSASVDISPGSGIANASIDIAIENPAASDLLLAGYTFFVEIEPMGNSLPAGVSFATPAATYSGGDGGGLLSGASAAGTVNLTPGAGDLGLSQVQFFDVAIAPDASEVLVTVNLEVNLAVAVLGDYSVSLSANGQNTISSTINFNQNFTSTAGTLSLTDASFVLGDVDLDGVVDFADIGPFVSLLSTSGFKDEADIDRNGVVDFLDIGPLISILSS